MIFEKVPTNESKEKPKKKKNFLKTGLAVLAAGMISQAGESGAADNIKGTAEKIDSKDSKKIMRITQEQLNKLQKKPDIIKRTVVGGSESSQEKLADKYRSVISKKAVEGFKEDRQIKEALIPKAPKIGLSQEIFSEGDAGPLENLSEFHQNWENKPAGALLPLLNKDPGIEAGPDFNFEAAKTAKKINILCGGIQNYKNLGEAIKVASKNSKQMNMPLSSSEIDLVLSEIERVESVI